MFDVPKIQQCSKFVVISSVFNTFFELDVSTGFPLFFSNTCANGHGVIVEPACGCLDLVVTMLSVRWSVLPSVHKLQSFYDKVFHKVFQFFFCFRPTDATDGSIRGGRGFSGME